MAGVYVGNAPLFCDLCKEHMPDEFYDASIPIAGGTWGNVCPSCFRTVGGRLGVGFGQHYKRVNGGVRFVCVEGGRTNDGKTAEDRA